MENTDSQGSDSLSPVTDTPSGDRQWFNIALASIGDAVITTDAEGKVTFLNPVAETLTGWSLSEAEGLPLGEIFKVVNEETRQPVENPALKALRDGAVARLSNHTILISRGGKEIAIDDSGAPIKSGEKSTGAVLVFRDISERRQGERARALLAGIVDSSEDAIISKTLEGIITSWNGAAERMFEYTAEEAVGNSITMIIPADRLDEETEILSKLRRGERIEHFDTIRVTKTGKLKNISLTVSPVRDRSGRIIGASKIARDITDRVRADAERAQLHASEAAARQEAEFANRAKDEFLAMVSHEMRSPLNAILGWSQILERQDLDKISLKRATETIRRNARSQVQLLSDLMDISRVITGKLRINSRPIDLRHVLDAAIETLRPATEAKLITIDVQQTSETTVVSGDGDRLQQVFWNLLSNAVKFTPTEGRILISVKPAGSNIAVEVTDSGVGIDPDFLPYVFDRFSQADGGSTRRHGGLGLGLAIVRHLIELHGGLVSVYSKGRGEGASFTVTLPVRAVIEAAASKRVAQLNLESAGQLAESITLAGVKVLVVDDEPDARELLTLMLQERGAEVRTASSADEAIGHIDEWEPSILLSDISMPGEDGYSLIRRVRRTSHGTIPAVALTAYARAEDRIRALAAGFQMHVPKPIEAGELVMVIASLTHRDAIL